MPDSTGARCWMRDATLNMVVAVDIHMGGQSSSEPGMLRREETSPDEVDLNVDDATVLGTTNTASSSPSVTTAAM